MKWETAIFFCLNWWWIRPSGFFLQSCPSMSQNQKNGTGLQSYVLWFPLLLLWTWPSYTSPANPKSLSYLERKNCSIIMIAPLPFSSMTPINKLFTTHPDSTMYCRQSFPSIRSSASAQTSYSLCSPTYDARSNYIWVYFFCCPSTILQAKSAWWTASYGPNNHHQHILFGFLML